MRGIVINFFIIHSCFCVAFGFSLIKLSNANSSKVQFKVQILHFEFLPKHVDTYSSIHYARLISGCGKTLHGIALWQKYL